jgi:hypothetical protein
MSMIDDVRLEIYLVRLEPNLEEEVQAHAEHSGMPEQDLISP